MFEIPQSLEFTPESVCFRRASLLENGKLKA